MPSQLQTPSLEDLLCSHVPLSNEDDASPGCATTSQVPFKAFLSTPELHTPRNTDRKLCPLLSPLQDPLVDKTLLESREMVRPKKVCFSESSLPSGDRTRRSYYLNGMGVGCQAGTRCSSRQWGREALGGQLGTACPPIQHRGRVRLGDQGQGLLYLIKFFAHLKEIELLFLSLCFKSSSHSLDTCSFLGVCVANMVSQFVAFPLL